MMTWWFDNNGRYKQVSSDLPSYVGVGPSEFELMLNHRLFWYILWLVIYLIITLIVYVIFRVKKHEYPLIDTLKISWIWWIIIALVLYFLYYIFVWSCTQCAYWL